MANEKEGTKSFHLNWEVPLRQFQVDTRLFKPLPPMESVLMLTPLSHVTLEWTLTLAQNKTDARIALNHKTKGIPNLGVQFTVNAQRRDGTTGKLTAQLREALAKTGSQSKQVSQTVTDVYLHTKEYIFNRNESGGELTGKETVKLSVCVYINDNRFHPKNVMTHIINQFEKENSDQDLRSGEVGSQLWRQVETGEFCDVHFDCGSESSAVHAHSAVLSAFSTQFAEMLHANGHKNNGWHLSSQGVRGNAVREVLYFVYNRKVSSKLHKAPLNEVLEASKLFGVPMGLKLEVERLLVMVLNAKNLGKMWRMSKTFDLKVIRNMVVTRCGNKIDQVKKLEQKTSEVTTCQQRPDDITAATQATPAAEQLVNEAHLKKQIVNPTKIGEASHLIANFVRVHSLSPLI